MADEDRSSIRTRPSLLNRLKGGDDADSWHEFYRIYGKLVRDFAIQAGLTHAEADEIMQETAIAVSRHLPEFRYDPKVCRFKTWLLNQASWRVKDQFRKRARQPSDPGSPPVLSPQGSDTTTTPVINSIADPSTPALDAWFESEWRKNLFATALERVKGKFSLKQFQVFDLLVVKEWPAMEVARALGVSLANVYVIKHRVAAATKKEIKLLEKQFEQAAGHQSKQPEQDVNAQERKEG